MAFALAFQNSVLNMRFYALKTCSDKGYFELDFISHAELLAAESRCSREFFGMLDDDMMVVSALGYLEG